jgi:hypothetical protein
MYPVSGRLPAPFPDLPSPNRGCSLDLGCSTVHFCTAATPLMCWTCQQQPSAQAQLQPAKLWPSQNQHACLWCQQECMLCGRRVVRQLVTCVQPRALRMSCCGCSVDAVCPCLALLLTPSRRLLLLLLLLVWPAPCRLHPSPRHGDCVPDPAVCLLLCPGLWAHPMGGPE